MEVEVSQFCFELEDMRSIKPFWQWLKGRIRPNKIYTEPENFEDIMNGQKEIDENKYLEILEFSIDFDSLIAIQCTYNGQTAEIITVTSQRLSDHRFKIEYTFWEPVGWPKKNLWEIFNSLLKDLSHDYPDARKSLRNSILGFNYEDLDNKQKLEIISNADDHPVAIENTNLESTESLFKLHNYLKACIEWVNRPYIGGREIDDFLSSTFGSENGYPVVSKGRFYRYLQKAVELGLIKKDGRFYKLAYKTRAEALKRLEYIIQNWNSIRTQ
ncbi:MAG: hypothetical protein C3F13_14095 [Anaerolineales bacterium]|nr:MAG: hypothetical protein C3F13_14095 [Anaerolineales bacterium]